MSKLIEAMARAIRDEIIKGWDRPLSTTPESQAGAAAVSALAAMCEGEALEEMRYRAAMSMGRVKAAGYSDQAVGEIAESAIRAALTVDP